MDSYVRHLVRVSCRRGQKVVQFSVLCFEEDKLAVSVLERDGMGTYTVVVLSTLTWPHLPLVQGEWHFSWGHEVAVDVMYSVSVDAGQSSWSGQEVMVWVWVRVIVDLGRPVRSCVVVGFEELVAGEVVVEVGSVPPPACELAAEDELPVDEEVVVVVWLEDVEDEEDGGSTPGSTGQAPPLTPVNSPGITLKNSWPLVSTPRRYTKNGSGGMRTSATNERLGSRPSAPVPRSAAIVRSNCPAKFLSSN